MHPKISKYIPNNFAVLKKMVMLHTDLLQNSEIAGKESSFTHFTWTFHFSLWFEFTIFFLSVKTVIAHSLHPDMRNWSVSMNWHATGVFISQTRDSYFSHESWQV